MKFTYSIKLIAALLTCSGLIITSCKKEVPFLKKTIAEQLVSYRWHEKDVQLAAGFSVADSCDLDNILTLKPDSSCMLDNGTNSCDTIEPRINNGSWQLIDNGKKIELMGYTYEIAVLQKDYLCMWLRNYVTPTNDTLDVYFIFNSIQ